MSPVKSSVSAQSTYIGIKKITHKSGPREVEEGAVLQIRSFDQCWNDKPVDLGFDEHDHPEDPR
jgi:hypothetical protein